MDVAFEVIGWVGAVAVLAAYLSVSMGWLRPSRRFPIANLMGSIAFIVNGAFHGAWPSVVTNIVWGLISIIALFRAGQRPEPARGGSARHQTAPGETLLTPLGSPEALAELPAAKESANS